MNDLLNKHTDLLSAPVIPSSPVIYFMTMWVYNRCDFPVRNSTGTKAHCIDTFIVNYSVISHIIEARMWMNGLLDSPTLTFKSHKHSNVF